MRCTTFWDGPVYYLHILMSSCWGGVDHCNSGGVDMSLAYIQDHYGYNISPMLCRWTKKIPAVHFLAFTYNTFPNGGEGIRWDLEELNTFYFQPWSSQCLCRAACSSVVICWPPLPWQLHFFRSCDSTGCLTLWFYNKRKVEPAAVNG